MSSPAGLNEDFNIAAARELTVAEIARIVWEACGEDPRSSRSSSCRRSRSTCRARWPSVEKARELLGWEARDRRRGGDRGDRPLAARAARAARRAAPARLRAERAARALGGGR